jgi:CheY-like chemotaxis protein
MHLQDLINDVLDVQQIEQGLMVLQRQPVDLAALVAEVVALLQPLAQSRQVNLGPPPAGPVWVLADPQRLRQVLLNLGSNAIKYNRPGGGVRWLQAESVQDPPAGHELQLHDDGMGMSALQLARLFQPFERLGRERSGIEGTGLGLVIARRLVEAQGGRITVHSQPAQGTTVQLWLPAALAPHPAAVPAPAPAPAAPPAAGALQAGGAPRRVLLVEDDPLSALLFGEALRAHTGLALRVAGNAETALALAAQWQPELLVIDGHLPDAKGHELLARLRLLPGLAEVPAVMATADAMPADREAALARGFVAHWPKPLDVRHLPVQLGALLAG